MTGAWIPRTHAELHIMRRPNCNECLSSALARVSDAPTSGPERHQN